MQLSQAKVARILEFGRLAAKAQSSDEVIDRTFQTLKDVDGIATLRVVYLFDHLIWKEWQVSNTDTRVGNSETWFAPDKRKFTVYFDSENTQSGYLTVSPKTPQLVTAANMLAPAVWNGLLLQSALRRGQRGAKSETEMVRSALRAREEERLRIAQELHDDLGQSMASLKLSLKWAEDQAHKRGGFEDVVRELAASRESVALMLGKVRDLSHTLYPKILDTLGLFAAIKELTANIGKHSGMKVVCTLKGRERPIQKEIGVALYRCCQESISNVLKHAGASRLAIELRFGDGEIRLTVEDNGRGFNPRALYDSSGKIMSPGFWTIRQRMADLGGAFSLSTARGQGTVVEVIVPFSSRENNGRRKNQNTASR
jgi:signal transduction histidine kinase